MRLSQNPKLIAPLLGMLIATGLAISYWQALLGALVVFLFGNEIRIRSEERLLREAFGSKFDDYARRVLEPPLDQKQLAEVKALEAAGKTDDPRYMQILVPMYYEQHILRMPQDQWPEPVVRSFAHINNDLYTVMQGPSELGASGRLEHWERFADLSRITVPTLVIGARYDTMDPAYLATMAKRLPNGQFLFLPNGSHLAMYDDQDRYFSGLLAFLRAQE